MNRLSVGVQTFDDALLEDIGRLGVYGTGEDIQNKLSATLGIFDTLNVDLIFNLPGQSEESLRRDVDTVKKLGVDQATFYPLMCSDTTKRKVLSEVGEVSHQREKSLYKEIVARMDGAYGMASAWCFSRAEGLIDEYIVDNEDYVGAGSGAFGYVNGTIFSNTFSIERYVDCWSKDQTALAASRRFRRSDRIGYDVLMGLFGGQLDLKAMVRRYGRTVWFELCAVIFCLAVAGAGYLRNGNIVVTARGHYYLVVLMREFFTGVNNLRQTAAEI